MTMPPDQQPQPFVIIGLKEVYDAVLTLTATVERLVNQQDDHRKDLADHESRLRSLERGRWPLPTIGALTGVAALILTVIKLLGGAT